MTNFSGLVPRRWKSWASDAAEHAVRALAGATIAAVPATTDEGLSLEVFLQWDPWSVGLGAAVLSVLMSLAGKRRGSPNNASLRR